MNYGKILQVEAPKGIYDKPVDTFVAGFIGSPPMNFIDCSFVEKNGTAILDAGTFTVEVSEFKELIKEKATGSELILGLRPEDVSVQKERTPGELIESEIYVIEPLGSEIIIDLRVGDGIVKAKGAPDFTANIGDTAWLMFNKNKVHVFDRKTQKTII